jgi:uncharacterized protein YnzC (UPF0291/DUF896 family)
MFQKNIKLLSGGGIPLVWYKLYMKIEEVINRINVLYKKRTEVGLTEEEQQEEKELREMYLENVRRNFRAQLDMVEKKERN